MGAFWQIHLLEKGALRNYWSNVYPDWNQKLVYWVRYKEPRQTATFEEYCYQTGLEQSDMARHFYEHERRECMISYPEDDLALLEDYDRVVPTQGGEATEELQ